MPLLGVGAEVGRRGRGPLAPHGLEALPVERQRRIVRRQPIDDEAPHLGALSDARETQEHPAALAKPVEHASLAQHLEMVRYARLALPEDSRKLGHGQLALGAQRNEAQPGGLGHRPQGIQDRVHNRLPAAPFCVWLPVNS